MSRDLQELVGLIRRRNQVDSKIALIIDRPATTGHIGEFIASNIFGITLEQSAANKGFDGQFLAGPLSQRTVNIKFSTKQDGLLNLNPAALPDFYLVLTGPKEAPGCSVGKDRPLCIAAVYLFDAYALVESLKERGVKLGIATSVARCFWDEAEVYPEDRNSSLRISEKQRGLLELFGA